MAKILKIFGSMRRKMKRGLQYTKIPFTSNKYSSIAVKWPKIIPRVFTWTYYTIHENIGDEFQSTQDLFRSSLYATTDRFRLILGPNMKRITLKIREKRKGSIVSERYRKWQWRKRIRTPCALVHGCTRRHHRNDDEISRDGPKLIVKGKNSRVLRITPGSEGKILFS